MTIVERRNGSKDFRLYRLCLVAREGVDIGPRVAGSPGNCHGRGRDCLCRPCLLSVLSVSLGDAWGANFVLLATDGQSVRWFAMHVSPAPVSLQHQHCCGKRRSNSVMVSRIS